MQDIQYRLSCIDDGVKTHHRVNSKSWFYFSVYGFPKNTKGKFAVSRVQTLMAVYVKLEQYRRNIQRATVRFTDNASLRMGIKMGNGRNGREFPLSLHCWWGRMASCNAILSFILRVRTKRFNLPLPILTHILTISHISILWMSITAQKSSTFTRKFLLKVQKKEIFIYWP